MIQKYLKDRLKNEFESEHPDITWTIDQFRADDNTVTVYYIPGRTPEVYDAEYRYPSYQVWIRSSSPSYSEMIAEMIYDHLHKLSNLTVEIDYKKGGSSHNLKDEVAKFTKTFHVFLIEASSDIIRVGTENGITDYSLNFDATLIELKQSD